MAEASATGLQGIKELAIIPSDFLNNFGASTASSMASFASRDWGNHNNSINFGGTSLSIKQVLIWGSVALVGFWLVRKIRSK